MYEKIKDALPQFFESFVGSFLQYCNWNYTVMWEDILPIA